eukprot:scaffold97598_cov33-Tisochrysis_lutea.AAC.4
MWHYGQRVSLRPLTLPIARSPLSKKSITPSTRKRTPAHVSPNPISVAGGDGVRAKRSVEELVIRREGGWRERKGRKCRPPPTLFFPTGWGAAPGPAVLTSPCLSTSLLCPPSLHSLPPSSFKYGRLKEKRGRKGRADNKEGHAAPLLPALPLALPSSLSLPLHL